MPHTSRTWSGRRRRRCGGPTRSTSCRPVSSRFWGVPGGALYCVCCTVQAWRGASASTPYAHAHASYHRARRTSTHARARAYPSLGSPATRTRSRRQLDRMRQEAADEYLKRAAMFEKDQQSNDVYVAAQAAAKAASAHATSCTVCKATFSLFLSKKACKRCSRAMCGKAGGPRALLLGGPGGDRWGKGAAQLERLRPAAASGDRRQLAQPCVPMAALPPRLRPRRTPPAVPAQEDAGGWAQGIGEGVPGLLGRRERPHQDDAEQRLWPATRTPIASEDDTTLPLPARAR